MNQQSIPTARGKKGEAATVAGVLDIIGFKRQQAERMCQVGAFVGCLQGGF